MLQPPQTGFGRTTNEFYHGNPAVEIVMIGGPYGDAVARRLGRPPPESSSAAARLRATEEPCARKILSTLATRAYRRPVTDDGSRAAARLLSRRARRTAASTRASSAASSGFSRAPSFLFRVERAAATGWRPAPLSAGRLDLASRLSFFLWGSIPDDELLNAGGARQVEGSAVLEQQVRRMLRDPRSKALVDNFASRWLELGKLPGVVPDTELYREFDENLRDAMEQETKLFVATSCRTIAASSSC